MSVEAEAFLTKVREARGKARDAAAKRRGSA
jgi:hypothetical protein